jgi:CRP-like cAMP-binding protein
LDIDVIDLQKPTATLAAYFSGGKRCTFVRNDVIVAHHANEPYIYWIEKGYVKVCNYSSRGSEMVLHIYKPQEIFPILALVSADAGPIQFVAYNDVVVRRRNTAELLEFSYRHPDTLLQIIKQQTFVFGPIINTRMETAEQKVVCHLTCLVSRFGVSEGEYCRITLPYTQKEFADSIGISRETSGRILGKLETDGVIIRSRRQTLVHSDRLRAVREELEL